MSRLISIAKRLVSWLSKLIFGVCIEDLDRAAAEQQQRINRRRRERMRTEIQTEGGSSGHGTSARDYEEWMNISSGRGQRSSRDQGRDN